MPKKRTPRPAKDDLLLAVQHQVQADLDAASASQKTAHEGATHEESRAENDKDTRGLETSYLARGLAKRVGELAHAAQVLAHLQLKPFTDDTPISASAWIVVCDEDDVEHHYLMLPVEGGRTLDAGDVQVKTVTPESPLGRALLGKCVDDEARMRGPQGVRELLITDVS